MMYHQQLFLFNSSSSFFLIFISSSSKIQKNHHKKSPLTLSLSLFHYLFLIHHILLWNWLLLLYFLRPQDCCLSWTNPTLSTHREINECYKNVQIVSKDIKTKLDPNHLCKLKPPNFFFYFFFWEETIPSGLLHFTFSVFILFFICN